MITGKRYESMMEYLKAEYEGPFCATDFLIRYSYENKTGLVLITRKNYPRGFAIPGGIAEKMPFQQNAIKEAGEETGLEIKIDKPYSRPFVIYEVGQDPRVEIASITYTAQGFGKLKAGDDAESAVLFTLDEIAEMLRFPVYDSKRLNNKQVWAFSHHKILLALYLNEVDWSRTFPQARNVENIIKCHESRIEQIMGLEMMRQKKLSYIRETKQK